VRTWNTLSSDPPRPHLNDAVHYRSHGSPVLPDGTQTYRSVCRAADVVEVIDPETGYCTLFVKNPQGVFFDQCAHDESQRGGTWHWPCDHDG
jgi:hypothetical protein